MLVLHAHHIAYARLVAVVVLIVTLVHRIPAREREREFR